MKWCYPIERRTSDYALVGDIELWVSSREWTHAEFPGRFTVRIKLQPDYFVIEADDFGDARKQAEEKLRAVLAGVLAELDALEGGEQDGR